MLIAVAALAAAPALIALDAKRVARRVAERRTAQRAAQGSPAHR